MSIIKFLCDIVAIIWKNVGCYNDVAIDKEMYQRFVGRLIYLSHTRRDIAFTMSIVS